MTKILIDREVVERALGVIAYNTLGPLADDLRAALEAAPASEQPAAPSAPASPRTVGAVERAQFENWAASCGYNIHRDDSEKYRDYHRATTRFAWEAWQARAGAAPCIGSDPACPCHDGDACHYKDAGKSKAWPLAAAPEAGKEPVHSAQPAHSKSEYKRRVALGDPSVRLPIGAATGGGEQTNTTRAPAGGEGSRNG